MPLVINKTERLIIVGSHHLAPTIATEVSEDIVKQLNGLIASGEIGLSETEPEQEVKETKAVEQKPQIITKAEAMAAARKD